MAMFFYGTAFCAGMIVGACMAVIIRLGGGDE